MLTPLIPACDRHSMSQPDYALIRPCPAGCGGTLTALLDEEFGPIMLGHGKCDTCAFTMQIEVELLDDGTLNVTGDGRP